jgi:DHA2 family multidrug resistance protein-like MFS transporter
LAFHATPSTDAALTNLPAAQVGSGVGIYKVASSLGEAIGAAISLALFTGLSGSPATIIGDVIYMEGRTDNIALRLAAMIALGVNLVFVLLAILIITIMVPKESRRISPKPQQLPDAVTAAGFVECPVCHGEGVVKAEAVR